MKFEETTDEIASQFIQSTQYLVFGPPYAIFTCEGNVYTCLTLGIQIF